MYSGGVKSTSALFQPDYVYAARMVCKSGSLTPSLLSKKDCSSLKGVSPFPWVPSLGPLWQLLSLLPALPDGALDTALRGDEAGSEEDLYEDGHSSSHHYSHTGGGGEQLAINEVQSGLRGWTGLGRATRPGEHLQHAHAGPDSHRLHSEQTAVARCARVTVPVCASRFGTWCPRAELVKSEVPPLCLHGAFREPRIAGVVPSTYDISP